MIRLPGERALARWRMVVGLAGLLLTLGAIPVAASVGSGGPLDPMGSIVLRLHAGLDGTSSALVAVGSSLASATGTLDGAGRSLSDAATVSSSLGQAMDDLAAASTDQVLGIQPFAGLAPRFRDLADRSRSLASSLQATGASVGSARIDLDGLRARVAQLRVTVDDLRAETAAGFGGGSLAIGRVALMLLLAWLAATAALSVIGSARTLRQLP